MLHRINNKTVQGEGFCVVVPDIHSANYTEGARTTTIEIEGGVTGNVVDWLVYADTLSPWDVQGKAEPMTETEKQVVLRRIDESLTLLDMPHQIV